MKRAIWRHGVGLFAAWMLIGCGWLPAMPGAQKSPDDQGGVVVSHGGPVRDHVSLVDTLRSQGLSVEVAGLVQQPFLRVKGTLLRLTGRDLEQPVEIQSYNYDDTDLEMDGVKAARDDAATIGPDGSTRTMQISWTGTPHFFRKERVIVIYVGEDQAVLDHLAEALGPPFASG